MPSCFFVTDLHGSTDRYQSLFRLIEDERPEAVFLGGDLLPSGLSAMVSLDFDHEDFVNGFLVHRLKRLRETLGKQYPRIFLILGNDDSRSEEAAIVGAATSGVWEYIHDRSVRFGDYEVYGYACIPPSPFLLKDWERYDVSQYTDPGCVPPEEGRFSVPVSTHRIKHATIKDDLDRLVGNSKLDNAIMLFHSPPYQTKLDRAAMDGKMIDHAPLDVHIGSIAIQRFIKSKQPLLTLHGHVHESVRLTGAWQDRIGNTICYGAAHDGPELALVRFDPDSPKRATRTLIQHAPPVA